MALWPLLYTNCPGVSILISSLLSKKNHHLIFCYFQFRFEANNNLLPPFFERYIPDKKWPNSHTNYHFWTLQTNNSSFFVVVLYVVKTAGGRNVQILDSWAKCRLLMMSNDRAVKTKELMNNGTHCCTSAWIFTICAFGPFSGLLAMHLCYRCWCIWANNLRNKCNSFKRFSTILCSSILRPVVCLDWLIHLATHNNNSTSNSRCSPAAAKRLCLLPISILDPINESIHVEIAQAHLLLVISLMNPRDVWGLT